INNKGDRFGNCGLKHDIYKKCYTADSLCGRIQCKNIQMPSLEDHSTIIHTSTGVNQCWGTDYHTGMKVNDIGAVRDGTPCGNSMLCIEGSCVDVSILKYDCNVTMCHNRGVCNTLKHCHCDVGWAPPDCRNKGYGGSIDSGPPPVTDTNKTLAIVYPNISLSDPCCQANCMLCPAAVCAFGLCCANCQYRQHGTVCREKISSCDLPEYCNGTSEHCPEDMRVQDGAVCNDGVYCYHENCMTHAVQNDVRQVNNKGDRFGNCGLKHGIYMKCDTGDSLYGRIQCKNIQMPCLEDHSTIIYTSTRVNQCWGTDYHMGMNINDIEAVRDGTPCGSNMMCIEGSCVDVSILKYDCNDAMCHSREVCNTHRHCHCDVGLHCDVQTAEIKAT
ncbi:Disintegrin and metalloproteinase domain-containing protein 21, partial [Ophiophagus hannah]